MSMIGLLKDRMKLAEFAIKSSRVDIMIAVRSLEELDGYGEAVAELKTAYNILGDVLKMLPEEGQTDE